MESIKLQHEPWFILAIGFSIGATGLPLGVGLLLRRRFALPLVYVMFGLTLLLAAIKTPFAIRHFTDTGESGSAFFEAELLFMWLLSTVYYRKRRTQFH